MNKWERRAADAVKRWARECDRLREVLAEADMYPGDTFHRKVDEHLLWGLRDVLLAVGYDPVLQAVLLRARVEQQIKVEANALYGSRLEAAVRVALDTGRKLDELYNEQVRGRERPRIQLVTSKEKHT
jgi:hypothetical protein